MQPIASPDGRTSYPPANGAHVTVTLINNDGSESVLSGTITNQPTKRRLGILLEGRFYYGYANFYSPGYYRLLIDCQIKVARASDVQLILLTG